MLRCTHGVSKARQACSRQLHVHIPLHAHLVMAMLLSCLQVVAGRKHVGILGVEPVGSYAIRWVPMRSAVTAP